MKWQELIDSHGWSCAVDSEFRELFKGKMVEFRLMRDPSKLQRGRILDTINDYENWHTIFAKVELDGGEVTFVNPVAISEKRVVE